MLNSEQQAVVGHTFGPALVIAGPGSGKTRTVTHRAARLVREGFSPEEIALVTFTRKAAGEMRERLAHMLPEDEASRLWISTFHSLAATVLRQSRKDLKVLDADTARKLIGNLLEDLQAPHRLTPKAAHGAISRAKNARWDRETLASQYADFEPYLSQVWERYEEWKETRGYLDFDDLLLAAVEDLKADPSLQRDWQKRCRFLTVDEYQDTNLVQFELVRLLLTGEENLMAVGDPNQAIYSWRGADYRLILEFKRHFPHALVYKLPLNYRSHRGITDAATAVIRQNHHREDLPLTALRDGDPPLKVTAETREAEALFVAEAAAQTLASGVPPEEIAVLMRSLSLSRPLEAALRRFRVPYTVVGGVGFWERREVKLLLHFLRAATGDTLALAEAIAATVPRFGPKKAQKAAEDPRLLLPVPEGRQLLQAVEDARRIAEARGLALAGETEAWLRRWREFLWPVLLDWAEGNTEAASERYMNTEEVANAMRGFAEHTPQGDLATFLQDILLEMEDGDLEKPQGVRLMTLHASKGLEFHSVFLVGLVEGVFPSWRSAQNPAQLEEERRLHYVGLTRAKENLYLTTYQVGERGPVRPSRFFTETPGQHLPYHPSIGYHGRETTEAVSGLAQIASLDW